MAREPRTSRCRRARLSRIAANSTASAAASPLGANAASSAPTSTSPIEGGGVLTTGNTVRHGIHKGAATCRQSVQERQRNCVASDEPLRNAVRRLLPRVDQAHARKCARWDWGFGSTRICCWRSCPYESQQRSRTAQLGAPQGVGQHNDALARLPKAKESDDEVLGVQPQPFTRS